VARRFAFFKILPANSSNQEFATSDTGFKGHFALRKYSEPHLSKWVNRDWAGQAAGPAMSAMPR
jgi:hypothetical protein